MRRTTAPAAAALAATLLAGTAPPAAAVESYPHPGGPFAFGERAVLEYPFGAYPYEYDGWDQREVAFTVDGVRRDGERAEYRLTVDLTYLGRTFGVADVQPWCAADGVPTGPPAPLPGPVELHEGVHHFALECPFPAESDEVEVGFTKRDAHGWAVRILFRGEPGR